MRGGGAKRYTGAVLADLVKAFAALFVVIDPIATAPLFLGLTREQTADERARTARRAVTIAAGILLAFALFGTRLLGLLGIELAAFRIAGGILLLLLSLDMVMVRQSGLRATVPPEEEESAHRDDVSVFPLAIPLLAGPGAMTTVVLLMEGTEGFGASLGMLVVLAGVLALSLACLTGAARLFAALGITGVNVVTRVSGILTAALAVQFVLDGLGAARSHWTP